MTPAGRATFGFAVRYDKDDLPAGNLTFHAGSLGLKAERIAWLVVTGSAARFRGEGHLGDAPVSFEAVARSDNHFSLTVRDAGGNLLFEVLDEPLGGGNLVIQER